MGNGSRAAGAFVVIGFFLFFLSPLCLSPAFANLKNDVEARRNRMMEDDALVWSWCEKCTADFDNYNDLIWNHLNEVWMKYASRSRRQGLVHLVRARYQYPQCFTQGQIEWMDEYLRGLFEGGLYGIDSPWKGAASANQQICTLSSMYLYAERHPDATTYFAEDAAAIWKNISYEGRSYSRGNTYNLLAFSRSYLQWLFDAYVDKTNYENFWDYAGETDSRTYTISQLKSLLMIRDLAQDETIARKADMVFTLVALNAKMDFSAKHWGGSLGARNYPQDIEGNASIDFNWGMFGDWTNYKYLWADPVQDPESEQKWDYSIRYDSQSVSLISPKPYDPILLEIGNTDSEPDNGYFHIHIEKNASKTNWTYAGGQLDSANWNYLTKYYNLGGNRNQWALQIRHQKTDRWGHERAYAVRFWCNSDYTEEDGNPIHYMGKRNIQFRNALFILDPETRNVLAPPWTIQSQENSGGWTFYRIFTGEEVNNGQNVEIVVAFENGNRALEVCTVGVDYPSYTEFKQAVLNHASVRKTSFTTSKGDVISTDGHYNYGLVNGKPIWGEYGHPIPDFPLMTTYGPDGNKMISWDWDTKRLTLDFDGQRKIYDFHNWTVGSGGDPAPSGCEGDLNEDADVNVLDLQLMVNEILGNQSGSLCSDINGDGETNVLDLQILITRIMNR